MKRNSFLTALFIAAIAGVAVGSEECKSRSRGRKEPLYTVVDGYKVDHNTMEGFRAWRAAACDRCHGPNQEGLVGPSLIES